MEEGDLMGFDDDYSRAIRSTNLKSKPDTVRSDSDVLGAAGLAARRVPLGMALLRLLSGDNHASREVVEIMSGMADGKAYRMNVAITRLECADMARAVLAWWRDGVCTACDGLGFERHDGTPHLTDRPCPSCRGTGKMPFERQFVADRVLLAQWMLAEVQRELSRAAPAARAALTDRADP